MRRSEINDEKVATEVNYGKVATEVSDEKLFFTLYTTSPMICKKYFSDDWVKSNIATKTRLYIGYLYLQILPS